MRINKIIYGQKYFKVINEKICKDIKMPLPEIEIVKASAKAIHKIMQNHKTPSINKLITRSKRTTAKYYHLTPKNKLYRTPLEVMLQLYNSIPADVRNLKQASFKKTLKKMDRKGSKIWTGDLTYIFIDI